MIGHERKTGHTYCMLTSYGEWGKVSTPVCTQDCPVCALAAAERERDGLRKKIAALGPVIEAVLPFAQWWIDQPDDALEKSIHDDELSEEMRLAAALALTIHALDAAREGE